MYRDNFSEGVISFSRVLQGPPCACVLTHNILAMKERLFFYVSQSFGLSLIHGGPGLQCLAPTVAHYLLGDATFCPSLEDIPDANMQQKIRRVSSSVFN